MSIIGSQNVPSNCPPCLTVPELEQSKASVLATLPSLHSRRRRAQKAHAKRPLLFVNNAGMPMCSQDVIGLVTRLSMRHPGRRVLPHARRRIAASYALACGETIGSVQKMMRHSDPTTTWLYADAASSSSGVDALEEHYKSERPTARAERSIHGKSAATHEAIYASFEVIKHMIKNRLQIKSVPTIKKPRLLKLSRKVETGKTVATLFVVPEPDAGESPRSNGLLMTSAIARVSSTLTLTTSTNGFPDTSLIGLETAYSHTVEIPWIAQRRFGSIAKVKEAPCLSALP
jgi:hypothetical protein